MKDVSDQEKAETSSTSEFDLLAYLEAEQESADLAGFKKKALGVCWEDLRVEGEGGEKVSSPRVCAKGESTDSEAHSGYDGDFSRCLYRLGAVSASYGHAFGRLLQADAEGSPRR